MHYQHGEIVMEKIVLNIIPKKHEELNCFFNNIIASIFEYWEKDIRFVFLDSISTKIYIENNEYKIDCFTKSFQYILNEICGIEFKNLYLSDEFEIENLILQMLKSNIPVGVSVDSYFLPWTSQYLKKHRYHSVLVMGVDDENYYCVDGFSSLKIEKISKTILFDHHRNFYVFNKADEKYNTKEKICKIIKSILGSSINVKMLKELIDDALKNSIQVISIENSNCLFQITELGWSRSNFKKSLMMLSECSYLSIPQKIFDLIDEVVEKWIIVKNLITKILLTNNKNISYDRIILYLKDIKNMEDQIKKELKKTLQYSEV